MNKKYAGLQRLNLSAAVLHALQATAIIWLAKVFLLPVTASFLSYNTATMSLVQKTELLFELSLPWLLVIFFGLSALAHLLIATVYNRQYTADLAKGLNRARWYEYALSASTMMVAIAMLVGIYDLGSLVMIFALVAVMNLMGLVMEVHNQSTTAPNWLSFNVGVLAGIIPWLVIAIYFWASANYGGGNIPTFVYWIYGSIFVFFNGFALNMYLQYKKIGPWKDYLYGERAYIILSLVAKSALAWQVFAGTLRP